MPRHSYLERDYVVGQVMLKLRTSPGLTPAVLAALLWVPRRAVGSGREASTIPNPSICNTFLGCVRVSVFEPGRHARLEGRQVLLKSAEEQ